MSKITYILVTLSYWAFMLTDGALRMLVLLHFHDLGYNPIQLAFLFLLYEIAGVVTNLIGGWIGSRYGLKNTLFAGLSLQIIAILALTSVSPEWAIPWSVAFVMLVQALSGVAKDLTKMASKSSVKLIIPESTDNSSDSKLFTWVAALTGSKNAIKGLGFFLGGALLQTIGFSSTLHAMAVLIAVILIASLATIRGNFGRSKYKTKFRQLFSKSKAINTLSFARAFLFASRDVWFVVGLPIFLTESLHWTSTQIGTFMASWVIGYGIIQAIAPRLIAIPKNTNQALPIATRAARVWSFPLAVLCILIAASVATNFYPAQILIGGLITFGVIFAVNSSTHSYLILAYTDSDNVSLNVGFYYMANAIGRLTGTLLSGIAYLTGGLTACLLTSAALVLIAAFTSLRFPATRQELALASSLREPALRRDQ